MQFAVSGISEIAVLQHVFRLLFRSGWASYLLSVRNAAPMP
jgi:hypothetical protein